MLQLSPTLHATPNLTRRYYFKTTSSVPTNAELLEEVSVLSDMRDGVAGFFADVVPEATVPPIILSEFNLVQLASAGCGATLQFINTIWHAEILGEAIQGGDVAALMSFSWADAAENCSNTGRGTRGDYGLVSYGSDAVEDGTPTTQFYAYALFNLAFGDSMVNSTISQGTSTKIKTYASTFSDGSVGIVVVNEDSAAHTMRFDGLTSSAVTVNGWVVASSDPDAEDPLSADGVTWNGETPTTFPLETSYAPYSTSASKDQVLEVDVPAYSVTGGFTLLQASPPPSPPTLPLSRPHAYRHFDPQASWFTTKHFKKQRPLFDRVSGDLLRVAIHCAETHSHPLALSLTAPKWPVVINFSPCASIGNWRRRGS